MIDRDGVFLLRLLQAAQSLVVFSQPREVEFEILDQGIGAIEFALLGL